MTMMMNNLKGSEKTKRSPKEELNTNLALGSAQTEGVVQGKGD